MAKAKPATNPPTSKENPTAGKDINAESPKAQAKEKIIKSSSEPPNLLINLGKTFLLIHVNSKTKINTFTNIASQYCQPINAPNTSPLVALDPPPKINNKIKAAKSCTIKNPTTILP